MAAYHGPAWQGLTFRVVDSGAWQVFSGAHVIGNGTAPGAAAFNSTAWHALSLTVKGTSVSASIDGAAVFAGTDATYTNGQVALAAGYHYAAFDDFSVVPAA